MTKIIFLKAPIVGNNFRPADARYRLQHLNEGEDLQVVAEPSNPYDANAVRVETMDEIHLGYIPKKMNADLSRQLQSGIEVRAYWDSDEELVIIEKAG